MCLFGFMNILIIIKWTTDWEAETAKYHKEHPKLPNKRAPSIIATMIDMFINGGKHPPGSNDFDLISNQTEWMNILSIFAFISVPVMLYVAPIYYSSYSQDKYKELKDVNSE